MAITDPVITVCFDPLRLKYVLDWPNACAALADIRVIAPTAAMCIDLANQSHEVLQHVNDVNDVGEVFLEGIRRRLDLESDDVTVLIAGADVRCMDWAGLIKLVA